MGACMQIINGNDDVFNMMISTPNQSAMSYVQQNIERLRATANPFIEQIQNMYNKAVTSIDHAKLAIAHIDTMFKPDVIYPILNIVSMQTAQAEMKRWIMANPIVNEMYQNQLCEGYEGKFYRLEEDRQGKNSIEYDMVMDGIVQFTDDETFAVNTCIDNPFGVSELSILEQTSILKTWEIMETMLKLKDKDPTSAFGNML